MTLPLLVLVLHFLGDWLTQQLWDMGLKKSKSLLWLTLHCATYAVWFWPFYGLGFALVTFVLHWCVDVWTSRLTSAFWFIESWPATGEYVAWAHWPTIRDQGLSFARFNPWKRRWFFVTIGADQLLHFWLLALTLQGFGR